MSTIPSTPRRCGKCHGFGHDRRTCKMAPNVSIPPPPTPRRCGLCNGFGHNRRTCKNGIKFTEDFSPKLEIPTDYGETTSVSGEKQFNGVNAPEQWGSENAVVELSKTSPEFTKQRAFFLKSFKGVPPEVIKIKRLQNPVKLMQYQLERQSMALRDKCPVESVVEKTLFHGTSMESVDSINMYGFNRNYGSVQAYGNGVYFARDSNLSADPKYAKPNARGHQVIYITKVLTGHYTEGKAGMKIPPNRKPGILFDSLVDHHQTNPSIFVSGHSDNQMYAEYLVEFKQSIKKSSAHVPVGHINLQNMDTTSVSIFWRSNGTDRCMSTIPAGASGFQGVGQYGHTFVIKSQRGKLIGTTTFNRHGLQGNILNLAVVNKKLITI
jgi:hypothetical protein